MSQIVKNLITCLLVVLSAGNFNSIWAKAEICSFDNFQDASNMGIVDEQFNNGKSLGPTRNQSTLNWCYSYSGADLLEQWLKLKGKMSLDEHISAFALGMVSEDVEFGAYLQQSYMKYLLQSTNDIELSTAAVEQVASQFNSLISLDFLQRAGMDTEDFNIISQGIQSLPVIFERRKVVRDELKKINPVVDLDKYNEVFREIAYLDSSLEAPLHQVINQIESKLLPAADRMYPSNDEKTTQVKEILQKLKSFLTLITVWKTDGIHPVFPGFGDSKDAIEKAWPNRILFESEILSAIDQDISFADELENYISFSGRGDDNNISMLFPRINHFSTIRLTKTQGALDTFNPLFFSALPSQAEDIVSEIINRSSSKKIFSSMASPNIYSRGIDFHGLSDNRYMNTILRPWTEDILRSGKVIDVSYHSEVLSNPDYLLLDDSGKINVLHTSLLTGMLSICGKTYFRIRNSWGMNACKQMQQHQLLLAKSDFQTSIDEKFYACQNNRGAIDPLSLREYFSKKIIFKGTPEALCLEQILPSNEEFDKIPRNHIPVLCDSNGDFIIERYHFEKAMREYNYIKN